MKILSRPCLILAAGAVLWGGCAVGPNYHRPAVAHTDNFRFAQSSPASSLGDLPWWQVFKDPVLQGWIGTALTNNYDLQQAVARVEQARNQAVAANAAFFPQIGYGGDVGHGGNALYNSPAPSLGSSTASSAQLTLGAAWEVDLWGRIRRSSEAARAQYLATDSARRGVTLTLVSAVASTYFQLLELDQEMEIVRAATNDYSGSYRIFNDRLINGVASKLETDRASAALANATALVPQLELQIGQTENQFNLLLGRAPGPVARRSLLDQQALSPEVPAGLPSDLLRRRPDVMSAEQQLMAATANVGVSVANFFPQIGLTTFLGRASPELSSFTGGAGNLWDVGGTLSGPVFQGGRLRAGYRAARAKAGEARAAYRQSVLRAMAEVSDALLARQKVAEVRVHTGQAAVALASSVDLATQRYLNGKSSYFEVLQAQQDLYPTQRAQVQAQVGEWLAVIQLYKALGGGWQEPAKGSLRP